MISRIPAGKHYSRPFRLGLYYNKKSFSWKVRFTDSCRYDLKSDDQFDTNKLCGVGYLLGWHHMKADGGKWMLGPIPWIHHNDSARFGWRYWPKLDRIELMAYCYVNGYRVIQNLDFCEIGKLYHLQLNVAEWDYIFNVIDPVFEKSIGGVSIPKVHDKKLAYGLWPYVGGTSTFDHDTIIELTKI